jgi:hypothetical protein
VPSTERLTVDTPLKAALRKIGADQRDLARHWDWNEATVSRWANGLRPSPQNRGRIIAYLNERGARVKETTLWP